MRRLIAFFALAGACATLFGGGAPAGDKYGHIPDTLKRARWIWPHVKNDPKNSSCMWGEDIVNSFALFRKTFELGEVPDRARLYITADQNYRLYINGEYVNAGPARGYQCDWPYDEIDVAKYLRKGKNVIAVRAYNAGRSTFQYISQGWAGLLFGLDLGGGRFECSGAGVRGIRQYNCSRDTAPQSFQMNNQEHIDMRGEPVGWNGLDFDDSSWATLSGGRVFNAMPMDNLSARGAPMMEHEVLAPAGVVARASGKSASDSQNFRNLNALYESEKASDKSARVDESAAGIVFKRAPRGTVSSAMVDFGRANVGFPILKIEGAKGGEIVDILMEEVMLDDLTLRNNFDNNSSIPAVSNRLVCREGSQEHQFFQLSGFRYMLIRVRANENSDLKITPLLRSSYCAMRERGKFEVSNPLANRIWEACRHTQRICTLDAYVDTPWREQAQWWGDARVQAKNTFFISGETSVLRRGIGIIARQRTSGGLTYGHAPTIAHGCILPDFSLIWICTLWDYYWQTGSAEAYAAHRDVVKGIFEYFDGQTNPATGLVKYDPRYWLFLDWTDIQKNGEPGLLNMWLLYALDKMERLSRIAGFDSDSREYAARAEKVRAAICARLLDKDGLLHDGILPDGRLNPKTSMQMQTLGKMCSLKGLDFERAKREMILPYLRSARSVAGEPSSYWVVYLFETMIDEGHAREVYDFILKRWAPMAEYGTTFEGYDHRFTSHTHAWSAHPAYILPRILGGVRQEAPAWKKVSFKPNGFESSGRVVYPTPHGDIEVQWGGGKEAQIKLPEGVALAE